MARAPIRRLIPNITEPIGVTKSGEQIFATEQYRQWMEAVENQLGGAGVDVIAEQEAAVEQVKEDTETVTQAASDLQQSQAQLDQAVQTVTQAASDIAQDVATVNQAVQTVTQTAADAEAKALEVETRINNANIP